jgi:heme exporter protein C
VIGFTAWFAAIVLLRMRAILAETRIEARQRRMARG